MPRPTRGIGIHASRAGGSGNLRMDKLDDHPEDAVSMANFWRCSLYITPRKLGETSKNIPSS